MDFYAEVEKSKTEHSGKLGELSYRRYLASKAIEDNEALIVDLDREIYALEMALRECDQTQRNFNSYLAVKEAALTTDDLAQAICDGNKETDND